MSCMTARRGNSCDDWRSRNAVFSCFTGCSARGAPQQNERGVAWHGFRGICEATAPTVIVVETSPGCVGDRQAHNRGPAKPHATSYFNHERRHMQCYLQEERPPLLSTENNVCAAKQSDDVAVRSFNPHWTCCAMFSLQTLSTKSQAHLDSTGHHCYASTNSRPVTGHWWLFANWFSGTNQDMYTVEHGTQTSDSGRHGAERRGWARCRRHRSWECA